MRSLSRSQSRRPFFPWPAVMRRAELSRYRSLESRRAGRLGLPAERRRSASSLRHAQLASRSGGHHHRQARWRHHRPKEHARRRAESRRKDRLHQRRRGKRHRRIQSRRFLRVATVPAGTNPDGIAFEPATKTVWAFNGRSSNISVLDTASNTVVATVPVPGKPEFPQADGQGSVFANIEDKNEIVKLDAASRKLVATWPLPGCESPSGMAIDRDKHRLFSVCDGGKMAVVDYDSGKVLGLAAIGDSPDAAGFDPKHGLAFSSNGGDGTLTVVDSGKPGFPALQTVKTEKGARTMALRRLHWPRLSGDRAVRTAAGSNRRHATSSPKRGAG